MEKKNSLTIDISKQDHNDLISFCQLNEIGDIDGFVKLCFRKGLMIEKYGLLNQGKLPEIIEREFEKEVVLRKSLRPNEISMDAFLDISTWEKEYSRVNNLMGLPLHLEDARQLYQSWYNIRVYPLLKDFNLLSNEEKSKYFEVRVDHEKNNQIQYNNWQIFYKSIRGVDWPDACQEEDFYKLPDWIQKEIIDKFGYNPE